MYRAPRLTDHALAVEGDKLLVALHHRQTMTKAELLTLTGLTESQLLRVIGRLQTDQSITGARLPRQGDEERGKKAWSLTEKGAKEAIFSLHRQKQVAVRTRFAGGVNIWTGAQVRQ